jgi:hypothetical protein
MKKFIAKETSFTHPKFNKIFDIYTDVSKVQLGAYHKQEGKTGVFYSIKLNTDQNQSTTNERQILFSVKTLNESTNILLE